MEIIGKVSGALQRLFGPISDEAAAAIESLQNFRARWLTAEYLVKSRYLKIVFLNYGVDVTLVPETRKPFDMLAEGLFVLLSRGERI